MVLSLFLLSKLFYYAFFIIIELYFLIPAVIEQIFDPIAELVNPMGTPSKEEKAGIEIIFIFGYIFILFIFENKLVWSNQRLLYIP